MRKSLLSSLLVLSLSSAQSYANDTLLWDLQSTLKQSVKVTSSHAIEVEEALVNFSPSQLITVKQNSEVVLPHLWGQLRGSVVSIRHQDGLTIYNVSNNSGLPNAAIFVRGDSVSAWIPTEKGTVRINDGRMFKEFKMGGEKPDFVVPHIEQKSLVGGNFSPEIKALSSAEATGLDDTSTYRVLFVVTDDFVQGQNNVSDTLVQYITTSNNIYQNTGLNIAIESAGSVQANLEEFTPEQILNDISQYTGDDTTKGTIATSLLQPIWDARIENSADFIAVIKNNEPDGECGLGWLNGNSSKVYSFDFAVSVNAFSTTFTDEDVTQECGLDTLTHELGHNMGLAHAEVQDGEGSVFTYGRGYGVNDVFSTIMGYPQAFGDATGHPVFSSPDLTCPNDLPCGIDRNEASGADAKYALEQVMQQVEYIFNEELTKSVAGALEGVEDSELTACINSSFADVTSNASVDFVTCYDNSISSLEGLDNFPFLNTFGISSSDETDLALFYNMPRIVQLDLRQTSVTSLASLSHIKEQLTFLQFNASSLSCQEVNVAESWDISTYNPMGTCLDRDNDSDDFDGDGINNLVDVDDDNDGVDDISDAAPFDASNADDYDNDGVANDTDAFPYNPNESLDTDLDTVGNNRDSDDDNDGVTDANDCAPLDSAVSTGCTEPEPEPETSFVDYDYDGDGKADVGVRRASNFYQYIVNSSGGNFNSSREDGIQRVLFGKSETDISVSGDFDGDKIADVAVRRPTNYTWYILNSSGDNTNSSRQDGIQRVVFGTNEADIPVPADYDGDGITDIAFRRESNFTWYILNSSGSNYNSDREDGIQRIVLGQRAGDIPVPADYDGDGIDDIAVRRPSNQFFYIRYSSNGEVQRYNFGTQSTDIPVIGDFDGDGKADVAVRRPSSKIWYVLNSSGGNYNSSREDGIQRVTFGLREEDIPIPADYDGDGITDIAVRRPSTQLQYILRSSDGEIDRVRFGLNSADMPLAALNTVKMQYSISDETSVTFDEEPSIHIEKLNYEQALAEELIE